MAEFEIIYGHGISTEGEIIDIGVEHELIEKAGSWYSYNGDRIGQGKENVREFLLQNKEVAEELNLKIREILMPSKKEAKKEAPADD